MILGTGLDLLKISRVKKVFDKYGDVFLKKIFSDYEIKKNKKIILKVNKLAKSFATKEAFVKALGTGFTDKVSFKDITIKKNKNGRPFINLSNRVQKYLKKKTPSGYKTVVNVSITDEKDYVFTNVFISNKKK